MTRPIIPAADQSTVDAIVTLIRHVSDGDPAAMLGAISKQLVGEPADLATSQRPTESSEGLTMTRALAAAAALLDAHERAVGRRFGLSVGITRYGDIGINHAGVQIIGRGDLADIDTDRTEIEAVGSLCRFLGVEPTVHPNGNDSDLIVVEAEADWAGVTITITALTQKAGLDEVRGLLGLPVPAATL